MVVVHINSRIFPFADEDFIYRIADFALRELGLVKKEITISIDKNKKIKELNKLYRGIDDATDVLSFAFNEIDPETGNEYLGDVIISFPKVVSQARMKDHSVREELALLIIHGILHLSGYDHDSKEKEKQMFALQEKLLTHWKLRNSPKKSDSLFITFRFAAHGILSAMRSERNMWIHLAISFLVIIVGLFLKTSAAEWALLVFAIALVITSELLNTALENLVDLISEERNEKSRRAKDISAAAVLIATIASTIIGLIVFLPKIISLF